MKLAREEADREEDARNLAARDGNHSKRVPTHSTVRYVEERAWLDGK
jgi:hypothetical protein